jgi:hypothetical protein
MRAGFGVGSMIVICANWAIHDGTFGGRAAIDAGPWLQAVHRAAHRAGFGRDGRYRPVDVIDIVFAGDTFDWLTSAVWTRESRPWHAGSAVAHDRARVRRVSVTRARTLLAGLARWVRRGLPVPRADRIGRPRIEDRIRVPVRVAFLSGDRDAALDELATEAARFGCSIGSAWGDEIIEVRHGDEWDPLCVRPSPAARARERCPTLRESIGVDLVARFGGDLLESGHDRGFVGRLVFAIGAVEPILIPAVLARVMNGHVATGASGRPAPVDHWRRAVDAWHDVAGRNPPSHGLACCPLDALAATLGAVQSPLAGAPHDAPSGLGDLLSGWSAGRSRRVAGGGPPRRVVVLGHAAAVEVGSGQERIDAVMGLGPPALGRSPGAVATDGTADGALADRSVTGRLEPTGRYSWEPLWAECAPVRTPLQGSGRDGWFVDAA